MKGVEINFPWPQPSVYTLRVKDEGSRVDGRLEEYDFWFAQGRLFVPPRRRDGVVNLQKVKDVVWNLDDRGVEEEELVGLAVWKKGVTICYKDCYVVGESVEGMQGREHIALPLWLWKWLMVILPEETCHVLISEGLYLYTGEWCFHIWKRRPPRQLEEYLDEE